MMNTGLINVAYMKTLENFSEMECKYVCYN